MIKCIIISHGDLGGALQNTTEKIIGPLDNIKVLSNELMSIKELIGNLDSIVQEWQDKRNSYYGRLLRRKLLACSTDDSEKQPRCRPDLRS